MVPSPPSSTTAAEHRRAIIRAYSVVSVADPVDRGRVEKLDLGQPHARGRRRGAKPVNLPQHARGDSERVGGQQHAFHTQRPDGTDDAQHHRRLLGVREDRCLRYHASNVSARHRIRDDPHRAAGDDWSGMLGHNRFCPLAVDRFVTGEYVSWITVVGQELHEAAWPKTGRGAGRSTQRRPFGAPTGCSR